MVDLDHFKAVNDTYGHQAGDALLNKVGDVLRSLVRAYDHAGRYGGDEFIVVAQDLSQDGAYDFAEQRIRSTVAQTEVSYEGSALSATATIGVAFAPSLQDRSPDVMIRWPTGPSTARKLEAAIASSWTRYPMRRIPRLKVNPQHPPVLHIT